MWRRIYLLSCVFIMLFFSGCTTVEKENFCPYPYSDEEYLDVSELNELPYHQETYTDIALYLTDFTTMLINQSFFYYGDIPNELSLYITKDDFKVLCISYEKKDDCFLTYQICDIKANHNFEKAIVDVKCKSSIREYGIYDSSGKLHSGEFFIKLYYINKNDTWIVEDVVSPP